MCSILRDVKGQGLSPWDLGKVPPHSESGLAGSVWSHKVCRTKCFKIFGLGLFSC